MQDDLWERRLPTTLSFKGCQELQELRGGAAFLVLKAGVGQNAGAPLKADRSEISSDFSDMPSPSVPAAILLGKETPTDHQVASCGSPHENLGCGGGTLPIRQRQQPPEREQPAPGSQHALSETAQGSRGPF